MLTAIFVLVNIVFLLVLLYYKFSIVKNYWAKKSVPYVKPFPLVGNMGSNLLKRKNIVELLDELYYSHPNARYIGIHQFHQPTLMVRDPELIKSITVKDFASFCDHSAFNRGIGEAYEGLFFVTVDRGWHALRTILTPAFTNNKLKYMFNLVDDCAQHFIDHFQKVGSAPSEMKDAFSRYTNDAILTTAFGVTCKSFEDKNNLIFTVGKQMADLSGVKGLKAFSYNISPFLTKLFNIQIITQKTGAVFANLVRETLEMRKKDNYTRPDMIDLMLKTNEKLKTAEPEVVEEKQQRRGNLTDKDITAAAISFYFAGFDTTSTVLTFIAYELAVHTDVQQKLRDEIDSATKRSNGKLNYEDVMNLEYLEMVIFETLRLWAPALFIERLCVKPFTIEPKTPDEKPVTIEKDTSIWIPVASLHKDPKYFEDPKMFIPERFSAENKGKIEQYVYMPFGSGPRTCIGNRYALFVCKLMITKLIQNFEIVPCHKTEIPIVVSKSIFIIPDDGIWLTLRSRSKRD
ncbi:hypothetical protein FQA39_LY09632 [Lamprigera yunnana]|nr:hypothetical protein FQA39_LY09632 [Lamprigera yunnana]